MACVSSTSMATVMGVGLFMSLDLDLHLATQLCKSHSTPPRRWKNVTTNGAVEWSDD